MRFTDREGLNGRDSEIYGGKKASCVDRYLISAVVLASPHHKTMQLVEIVVDRTDALAEFHDVFASRSPTDMVPDVAQFIKGQMQTYLFVLLCARSSQSVAPTDAAEFVRFCAHASVTRGRGPATCD